MVIPPRSRSVASTPVATTPVATTQASASRKPVQKKSSKYAAGILASVARFKNNHSKFVFDFDNDTDLPATADDMNDEIACALTQQKSPVFLSFKASGSQCNFVVRGTIDVSETSFFEPHLVLSFTTENAPFVDFIDATVANIVSPGLVMGANIDNMVQGKLSLKLKMDDSFLSYFDTVLKDMIGNDTPDKMVTSFLEVIGDKMISVEMRIGLFINLIDKKIGVFTTPVKITIV